MAEGLATYLGTLHAISNGVHRLHGLGKKYSPAFAVAIQQNKRPLAFLGDFGLLLSASSVRGGPQSLQQQPYSSSNFVDSVHLLSVVDKPITVILALQGSSSIADWFLLGFTSSPEVLR